MQTQTPASTIPESDISFSGPTIVQSASSSTPIPSTDQDARGSYEALSTGHQATCHHFNNAILADIWHLQEAVEALKSELVGKQHFLNVSH